MFEEAIKELRNQIRILNQKLPSVEESIRNYTQMTKNYEKERDDMVRKIAEYNQTIKYLEGEEVNKNDKESN